MTEALGFCTVATVSHLAFCRVLGESVGRIHPGCRLTVLLVDDLHRDYADAEEPIEIISPDQVHLDPAEFRRMAVVYEPIELACALKPWALRYVIDSGAECAVYVDGDTQLLAPVDALGDAARSRGVALVPHIYEPLNWDGLTPQDVDFLRFGTFNGGCLAVGDTASGRQFLEWWSARLARDAIYSDEEALYLDQRWLDLVPPIFDAAIVRDPGLDVAYWNRAGAVEWDDGRYTVAGSPLRLFHFSGFDPREPTTLSSLNRANPRYTTSQNPALARLCADYASQLVAGGFHDLTSHPYGFARTNAGFYLDRRIRRLYRADLLLAERGYGPYPPDPLTEEGARVFVPWLNGVPESQRVSRYMGAVYGERSDVRGRFPVLSGTDRDLFIAWAREFGVADAGIPAELLPQEVLTVDPPPVVPSRLRTTMRRLRRRIGPDS